MTARILVVEDDRYLLGILRDYLSYVGFEVAEAEDGYAGWTSFLGSPPDVVLSDVLLPRLNGLELAARIKSSEVGSSVPVVLMSAVYKDQDTIARNLRQCGADGYLIKPFSMPDLRAELLRHVPGMERGDSIADEAGPNDPELSFVTYRPASALPTSASIGPDFLAPLLLQLRASSHTGVLQLRDGARWKDIVLFNGAPVWADGGDGPDRLGTMLLEEGTITKEQFASAVQYMRDESADFGSALTDNKLLSPTDLYTQLRRLVERRVVSAFAWTVGDWTLLHEFPRQTTSFEVRPLSVLWKGIRAHGALQPIRREIGPLTRRYVIPTTRFPADFAELKKEDAVGFLGTFLSGTRTVEDLESMEILEPDDLMRSLWLMFKAGMIGFGAHPTNEDVRAELSGPLTLELPELKSSLTSLGEAIILDYLRLWQADFYAIFGLQPGATDVEIDVALGTLQPLSFDPSRLSDDLPADVRLKAKALEEWAQEARATLSDPERRAAYSNRFRDGLTGIYRKVSQPEQTEAAMFFEMGKAFIQTRDYREAELSFGKAVDRSPETAEYLAYQGWAVYRRGGGNGVAVRRARDLLDRALVLDDHLPIAFYFSGIIHRDQRHYDEAIRALESAVQFDSQFEAARKALQQTYDLTGR